MTDRRRGIVHCALAVLTATAVTVAIGETRAAQAEVNASAAPLVVYDNNIENMLPLDCADGADFNRLIAHLKKTPNNPDVFTVQQISNAEQLETLTKRLSDELPGTYAGKTAIPDPGSMGYGDRCGKMKNQQTNAVVFRTERLTLQQTATWRSDAPADPKKGTGPCRNLSRSSQDRVQNIATRLRDTATGKDITVASIHWPTGKWHGPDCAAENMKETNAAVDRLGGTLKVVGGDTNAKYSDAKWWNKARDLGFADPIAQKCGGAKCPPAHNTTKNYRIDFILAKKSSGFSNAATVTEKMTGGKYSAHRAVTAYVGY